MVGDDHPFVAQGDGGLGHLPERRAAVGPGGVGMAVTAQGGQDLVAFAERDPAALVEPGQVAVVVAVDGIHDHLGGRLPYAVEFGERARRRSCRDLGRPDFGHDIDRPLERADLLPRRELAVEKVDRLAQREFRLHGTHGTAAVGNDQRLVRSMATSTTSNPMMPTLIAVIGHFHL